MRERGIKGRNRHTEMRQDRERMSKKETCRQRDINKEGGRKGGGRESEKEIERERKETPRYR